MRQNNSIEIAVIPFKKGDEIATICTDGNKFAAIGQGFHLTFSKMWWANETLHEMGFDYDWASMGATIQRSFEILAAPARWEIKKMGVQWYGFRDGILLIAEPTKERAQFMCIYRQFINPFTA